MRQSNIFPKGRLHRVAARACLFAVFAVSVLLLSACSRIDRARLFELVYPGLRFSIPAGLAPNSLWNQDFPALPSTLLSQARANGIDTALVAGVFPLRARIVSLDGQPLDFFRSITILVCDPNRQECALQADEVFYSDRLFGNEGQSIDLQPGLRNVKEEFSGEVLKMQLVFSLARPSPATFDCVVEVAFEAVE